MKKLIIATVFSLLILFNLKVATASENINATKVEYNDYVIDILVYSKDNELVTTFNAGDKLSEYKLVVNVKENNKTINSSSKWKSPKYTIVNGEQSVKIAITISDDETFNVKFKIKGGLSAITLLNKTMNEKNDKFYLLQDNVIMDVGTNYNLTINQLEPIKEIKWESSNSKIAQVDENGAVTAIKEGVVTIISTIVNDKGDVSYLYSTINVGRVENSPTIDIKSNTVEVTDRFKSVAIGCPEDSKVMWNVSNRKIATIMPSSGTTIALSEGDVAIYCTITNDEIVYVLKEDIVVESKY